MSVYLYTGGLRLVKKSGVGQAILHQKKALKSAGLKVDERMERDTRIVHVNTVFPDSFFVALRAKRRGLRLVYYAHSTMEDFQRSFKASNALAPLFKRWIMLCYGLGDVILTPTEYSKGILASLLPKSVRNAIRDAPGNLKFAGYVEQEELRDAYCGTDVFAFPSKEETEGIVVLEALASGIPTVVRDIPVYDGWLAHGEHVYKADSVSSFAYFIEGLLQKKLPDLSHAGRLVAKNRNLGLIGKRLKYIYLAEGWKND